MEVTRRTFLGGLLAAVASLWGGWTDPWIPPSGGYVDSYVGVY